MSISNLVKITEIQDFLHKLKKLDLGLIAHQLLHHGWTHQQAMRAISCYKMFLSLAYLYPHIPLVPTQEIDWVWHCHILHTRKYRQDCQMLFGRFIDHEPDGEFWEQGEPLSLETAFDQTQALFEHYFGKSVLESTDFEQLDKLDLTENQSQQYNSCEAGHLCFQRSACGRPISNLV
ncbi:MAG: hypothetical protein AB1589_31065 [Cyanobacteriota bacterium]